MLSWDGTLMSVVAMAVDPLRASRFRRVNGDRGVRGWSVEKQEQTNI